MGYSAGVGSTTVLLLACPKSDLEGAHALCRAGGLAVLPAGGAGDLPRTPLGASLLIVDLDVNFDGDTDGDNDDGSSRPVARWHAELAGQLPLDPERFNSLLPPTWVDRHPSAFASARIPARRNDEAASEADSMERRWERQWELDGEPVPDDGQPDGQVFLPVIGLEPLPRARWIFTNELVPKQARRGRRFLPRSPTLVQLPD